MVVARGTGRKDYSQTVDKVYQTTSMSISGEVQSPLHWSSNFDMSGSTAYTATVYTIPTGKKLGIFHARFSVPSNTLIFVRITSGGAAFASGYGYGHVDLPIPNGYILSAGSILGIYVSNYDTSTRSLNYYIQGILEDV